MGKTPHTHTHTSAPFLPSTLIGTDQPSSGPGWPGNHSLLALERRRSDWCRDGHMRPPLAAPPPGRPSAPPFLLKTLTAPLAAFMQSPSTFCGAVAGESPCGVAAAPPRPGPPSLDSPSLGPPSPLWPEYKPSLLLLTALPSQLVEFMTDTRKPGDFDTCTVSQAARRGCSHSPGLGPVHLGAPRLVGILHHPPWRNWVLFYYRS